MKNNQFKLYQKQTIDRLSKLLANSPPGFFDEQALPAYTNPNLLMRWLFWQRIWHTIQFIEERKPINCSLDFGCGQGVMLPYLNSVSQHVIALDLDVLLVQELGKDENWNNVCYTNSIQDVVTKYSNSIDLILALDVLEHVDDLENLLRLFAQLLSPKGIIILSGPTENIYYQLGRRLAGYSGEYHQRNIYDIIELMEKFFTVEPIKRLIPLVPLFEVAFATNK